ncbi:MAG: deoxyribonuclease IV [Patescibacteria group bacterium]|nr:deoxyribonuclease IV [Patescibacteria group bacterium]MDE2439253.1 deoxyribonuclease IV [Patescibacteria group bacterium]
MKSKNPYIGAHVSGGLRNVIMNAEAIGAECIQFFGASPRQWNVSMPKKDDISFFKDARKQSAIKSVYLHAAYLPNLATADPEMYRKSIDNLVSHLHIASCIDADGLIFHVGSGKEAPKDQALAQAVAGMKEVLARVPGSSKLVMENAAGGGQKLGATPHELGIMLRGVRSSRMGVCIDTAHAFEAGIIEAYTKATIAKLCEVLESEIGLENVRALHVNDSKTVFNSHHDRHENIGEGHIGLQGFKALVQETRLYDKAWILEVPGFDGGGPDARNVSLLKGMFNE